MSDQTQEPKTDETPTEDNVSSEQTQEQQDYLSKLVGEEKKYKELEGLAKGYDHLEKHAKLLEKENRMYKERLEELNNTNKTVDDILAQLNQTNGKETSEMEDSTTKQEPNIEDLVYQALDKKEKEKQELSLRQQAKDRILEAFGNDQTKANEAMSNYIGGDPARDKLVKEMSVADPEGLVRLITPNEPAQESKPNFSPAESDNKTALQGSSDPDGGMLTWSKAKEVMLNDPNTYYSRGFREKLNKSIAYAEENGIDFYSS